MCTWYGRPLHVGLNDAADFGAQLARATGGSRLAPTIGAVLSDISTAELTPNAQSLAPNDGGGTVARVAFPSVVHAPVPVEPLSRPAPALSSTD